MWDRWTETEDSARNGDDGRRAPSSTFHENFSCYRSLSWSRGYARGGCSLVGLWRGRDVDVERMEWEWGARRDRETTEKQHNAYPASNAKTDRHSHLCYLVHSLR
ncbi:hypothetical protein ALC53_02757 [Atta colombica]|uniref:Uncharacterized protein n=1 Tax=Atta colombica TaxID=520822 RepID=A0A195BP37_9HYME|nr:hypothetical protein ALC53_02757 [Atta colombica]